MPQVAKCECEGFEDCWDSSREEHFTRTIHDEECPKNPERMAEDEAEYRRDAQRDLDACEDLDWDAMESSDADPGL